MNFQENHHNTIARLLLEKLEFEDEAEMQQVLLRLLVNLAISYDDDNIRNPLLETVRRVKAVSLRQNSPAIKIRLFNIVLNLQNNLADSKNKDLLRLLLNLQGRPESQIGGDNVSSTPRSPMHRRTLIMDKENLITPIRVVDGNDQEMASDEEDAFKTPRMRSIRN